MGYSNNNNNRGGDNGAQNGDTMVRNGKNHVSKNGKWVEQRKKSGSKSGQTKHGGLFVTAWNKSKSKGFITVKAFENKLSKVWENAQGEKSMMMIFEIFYHNTGNKVLNLASYKINTGKVFLDKINMVISTKAPNGGYFGQGKK